MNNVHWFAPRDFMATGDRNESSETGRLAWECGNGRCICWDDRFGVNNVPTTRGNFLYGDGTRRIDCAYGNPLLDLVCHRQLIGTRDHDLVVYDLRIGESPPRFVRPKFQELNKDKVEEAVFVDLWDAERQMRPGQSVDDTEQRGSFASPFERAIAEQDANVAWTVLSDPAEIALGTNGRGLRRSQLWEPKQQTCRQRIRRMHSAPVKLRRLESLLRRVKELELQPLSNRRREIVAWTLSDLVHHYPELSDFQAWCIEHRYKELSEIVDHHAACNRQEQIDSWASAMDD